MKYIILFEANSPQDRNKIMEQFTSDLKPLEQKSVESYMCLGNKIDAVVIISPKTTENIEYYLRRFRTFSKITVIPAENSKDFPS